MSKKRVLVHYMHEHQEAVAREKVAAPHEQFTPSFVIADLDLRTVAELEAKGLVVEVLGPASSGPPTELVPRPGPWPTLGRVVLGALASAIATVVGVFIAAGRMPRIDSAERSVPIGASWSDLFVDWVSKPPGFTVDKRSVADAAPRVLPNYFVVELNGPPLAAWLTELESAHVTLLERVEAPAKEPIARAPLLTSHFTAKVRSIEEWRQLASFVFVKSVTQYIAPRPRAGDDVGSFNAVLHPGEDTDAALQLVCAVASNAKVTAARRIRFSSSASEAARVADIVAVSRVEPISGKVRLLADQARSVVGLPQTLGHQTLQGAGELIGMADSGIDATHPDLQARIAATVALGRPATGTTPGLADDPHGHGTHVAGILAGAARGVAPQARLYVQSLLDKDGGLGGLPEPLVGLFADAYAAGVRVHNNSWGIFADALYTSMSEDVDAFVREHPDFVIVIAAGNSGSEQPASPGRIRQSAPGFVDWSSIEAPATAKNAIVVGASRNGRSTGGRAATRHSQWRPAQFAASPIADELVSGNPECLAGFSSRGPTSPDLMMKPDIVAPGTDIASCKSTQAPLRNFWGVVPGTGRLYAYLGGTSMAAPMVAGAAALVREYYRTLRSHPRPSAALVKATLINGTRWLNGACAAADHATPPNMHQGFGRLDMPTTIPAFGAPHLDFVDEWEDPGRALAATGANARFEVTLEADGELRVCMTYSDLPARGIQNIVSLWVENLKTTAVTVGNANPWQSFGAAADRRNTLQIARVTGSAGASYRIHVNALALREAQHFALVTSGPVVAGSFRRVSS